MSDFKNIGGNSKSKVSAVSAYNTVNSNIDMFANLGNSTKKEIYKAPDYSITYSDSEYGILDALEDAASKKYERNKQIKDAFLNILDLVFTDENKGQKTNVWSSFYGSEAKHTRDHISHYLFGRGKGLFKSFGIYDRVGAPNRKDGDSKIKDFMNNHKKGVAWSNGNNYRVGQNWGYGSVNFASKKIYSDSGYIGDLSIGVGKKGETPAYAEIGLLHHKVSADASFGPDHVVLSGSAEFSLIHGEAGASGTFWEPKMFGTNVRMVGADGSVSADVVKAYAKGKIGLGYYKAGDGKYHLDAGINGEIGVEACSVQANGSITIAGTDIGVMGKAKIGVGAQINVGFEDGKFNCHIGAALGIGFELGFTIDMGGTFEVAKNAVKEGLDALEDISDSIANSVSEGWEDLKNSEVGKAVNKFTSWLFG